MKTSSSLLLALLGVAPAVAAVTAAPAPAGSRIEVHFFEPEKFTDVRDSDMGTHERTTYLEQIRDHLLDRAKRAIPEGYKLAVTFNDIDMAGDFEPWHGPRWSDVRIVKDIYPPAIKLVFRLTDAEGNIVKEGRRDLRDLAFMMKLSSSFRSDSVRHEKALLDDWLRAEFPRVRGT